MPSRSFIREATLSVSTRSASNASDDATAAADASAMASARRISAGVQWRITGDDIAITPTTSLRCMSGMNSPAPNPYRSRTRCDT